jgi:hypothetical protein
VKAEIRRGTLRGIKIGFLIGLCVAALYVVIGVLGGTEITKSLGFSLLLVGFPTFFAIVPALQWLGAQGGTREGVLILWLTLPLNGALWGAVIGAAVTLGTPGHWTRVRPES